EPAEPIKETIRRGELSVAPLLEGSANLLGAFAQTASRRIGWPLPTPPELWIGREWSFQYELAMRLLSRSAFTHANAPYREALYGEIRAIFHTLSLQTLLARRQVKRRSAQIAGVPGTWFTPAGRTEGRLVLYTHGGGYVFGSSHTHSAYLA